MKMFLIFRSIVLLVLLAVSMYGHDLLSKVINYRCEVKSVNPDFVNFFRVVTYKYNRSVAAINITSSFKVDIDQNVDALAQAYKLSGNRFRLFPVRFQVNFWEATISNVGGLSNMYKCGNLPPGHCFKKDVFYYVYNFVPNDTQLPPLMPTGEYMAEITAIYRNQELLTVVAYGEVYRPTTLKNSTQ